MKKVIINENQKGFLFKSGRYIKLLHAGKHFIWGDTNIEIVSLEEPVSSGRCALDTLLSDNDILSAVRMVEVADEQLVLHFVNGNFHSILRQGKYAF